MKKTILHDCNDAKIIIFLCEKFIFDEIMDKEEINRQIGMNIRKLRVSRNLSIMEFSDKLNIEYNNLIRIEKGRTNPTLSTLSKISRALSVKLTDIVDIN
ncbi:hypothetical protein FACS1894160_2200 [Bacteroidia bacterium]|nr:hypothetical protein FACS1894160_2200 [Bacteroidia bacterium]